jgi:hypothetical protein
LAADEKWTKTAAFASAFPGGSHPYPVSESKISRWETGVVKVPHLAVRRYEELLELPRGLFVAVIDTINRYGNPNGPAEPRAHRLDSPAGDHARFEELLDRVAADAVMSGDDWDDLTAAIQATPALAIVPRRLWTDIAERLLAEMIIADGVAWMRGFEAFKRRLVHPGAQAAAGAACASLATDRTNQVFIETVGALDGSPHPDASRHVLSQLSNPTNERARYGALLACVRKVRHGHFTPTQLLGLRPAVTELLADPASRADARPLAVELLRQLPATLRGGDADTRLRRALAGDRTLTQVLTAGRLAAEESAGYVVDRLIATILTRLPRMPFADEYLAWLVDETLFAPVFDVRLYATMLLYATPYRSAVAAAMAGELSAVQLAADPTLVSSVLNCLRVVGGAEQRSAIERLIVAPGLPREVSVAAAQNLGHVGGVSPDRFWLTALALHVRRWRRAADTASAATLDGLVYALGMGRHDRLLARVRDDREAPPSVRSAAGWWLRHPLVIRDSALT